MIDLPGLAECDHPGLPGSINSNLTPKNWAKPDTLVLTAHDEWTTEDDKAHECDRTVTIAIATDTAVATNVLPLAANCLYMRSDFFKTLCR